MARDSTQKTACLLLGFGGPKNEAELIPFLQRIFGIKQIPEAALETVVTQYRRIGWKSPYVRIAQKQAKALRFFFKKRNKKIPVFLGFLYSKPFLADVLKKISKIRNSSFPQFFSGNRLDPRLKISGMTVGENLGMTSQKKFKKLMVTVLSPFRSEASFGRYQKAMGSAKGVHTTASFAGHPLFIGAHRERVLEVLKKFSKKEKDKTYFIFTAHSIPKSMSKKSAYVREFSTASRLTAKSLGLRRWALAYQSRSTRGGPEPWLEPSIEEALSKVSKKEFKNIFFIPVGFLVDHKEVLYDLDIQAREQAERLGFNYFRSRTLMDHPKFIRLLAKLVTKALSSPRSPNRHSRML